MRGLQNPWTLSGELKPRRVFTTRKNTPITTALRTTDTRLVNTRTLTGDPRPRRMYHTHHTTNKDKGTRSCDVCKRQERPEPSHSDTSVSDVCKPQKIQGQRLLNKAGLGPCANVSRNIPRFEWLWTYVSRPVLWMNLPMDIEWLFMPRRETDCVQN